MVVVWKVSTHQTAFQHSNYTSSNAPVIWQPHSHNLAFTGMTQAGNNFMSALEIWNATTGKLVKQYTGGGSDALAWSPDGTALASTGYIKKSGIYSVVIIDVLTGKQLFVCKGHHVNVSVLAWSPDGRYIVSGEGNTSGNTVAKVWTAV
jgi:WD40 repeat protein